MILHVMKSKGNYILKEKNNNSIILETNSQIKTIISASMVDDWEKIIIHNEDGSIKEIVHRNDLEIKK